MSAQTTEQTGTDLARTGSTQALTLRASMDYAHALAASNMLPAQFRGRPENVLWAMEYGRTIGLTAMAAITGVHVIEGKPSASAGLISGLVRRAGHKLRVTGNNQSATCTIIRSDDPDHPFVVTWELRKNANGNPNAEEAGLLSKGTWKNYPAAMLKSRAISQCARDACEEVLFGLHYTPEELGAEVNDEGAVVTVASVTPIREEPAPGPTAAEIATLAAATDDPASIRAAFTDASARGLLDADIWEAVGYQAAMLGVSVGDLSLRQWLTFCGTHAKDASRSVDAECLARSADEDDDTEDAEVIGDEEREALL